MTRPSVPFQIQRPWLILSAMYLALIFFVSSRPYLHAPGPDFPFKDKFAHCIEYGILGWFMARAMRPAKDLPRVVEVLWFVALGAGIAAADELFQGTVAGRMTDVADWAADVTGLLLGSTFAVSRARRTRIPR